MQASHLRTRFSWRDAIFGIGGIVLLLTLIIIACGITFIHSASYQAKTDTYKSFAKKQIVWFFIASIPLIFLMIFDYNILVKYAFWFYFLGIILLLTTALFGTVRGGSRRWLKLGSVMFQTSEFMKFAMILVLAKILTESNKVHKNLIDMIPAFVVTSFPMLLVLLQPDMGTSLVFVPILFVLVFVSGASVRHVVVIILISMVLVVIAYFVVLKPYQRQRVDMFLGQERMTQEQKRGSGYHLDQSKISHGAGGLSGQGLYGGTQNKFGFLPERHTDFIFAVVGEEWGFIGTTLVLLLYFLLFGAMLMAAYTTLEPAGQLIIIGIVTLLAMQTVVNTCMTVGLAPITGLPLPFMSYGGTSLVFAMGSVGLILSIKGRKIIGN